MRRNTIHLILAIFITTAYAWPIYSTGSHTQSVSLLIRLLTNTIAFLLSVLTILITYRFFKSAKTNHSDEVNQEAIND